VRWPREPAPSAQSVCCSQTPRLNLPLGRLPQSSSLPASQRRSCASLPLDLTRPISIATFANCSLAPRGLPVVCAGGCEVRLRDAMDHTGHKRTGGSTCLPVSGVDAVRGVEMDSAAAVLILVVRPRGVGHLYRGLRTHGIDVSGGRRVSRANSRATPGRCVPPTRRGSTT